MLTYVVVGVLQGVQGCLVKLLHEDHIGGGRNEVENVVDTLFTVVPGHCRLGVRQQLLVVFQSLKKNHAAARVRYKKASMTSCLNPVSRHPMAQRSLYPVCLATAYLVVVAHLERQFDHLLQGLETPVVRQHIQTKANVSVGGHSK